MNIAIGGDKASTALAVDMSKGQAKDYNAMVTAGRNASAVKQDIEVLQELTKVTPTNLIDRAIADRFPGLSSAAGGYKAVVQDLAAKLHVPGIGSQSDKEYSGALSRFGAFIDTPQAKEIVQELGINRANILIAGKQAIQKFNVDIKRKGADIPQLEEELNNTLDVLDQQSIMTPHVKSLIQALGSKSAPAPVNDDNPLGLTP